jgi:predicted methyltransferase
LIFNKLLNQIPNKNLFPEIYRVLKPSGSFYIYDIVSDNSNRAEADIKSKKEYVQKLNKYGFKDISIIDHLDTALISGKK